VTLARTYILAVAVALVVAEIVHPNVLPHKGVSHPSLAREGGRLPLSWEQLDDLPPVVQPAIGNIDLVTAVIRGKKYPVPPAGRLGPRDSLIVQGWCADPQAHEPGAGLLAIVDDSRRIDVSAGYGKPRDDAAKLYAAPAMSPVGFDFRLTSHELGVGAHTLRVAIVASDGHGIFVYPVVAQFTVEP
jgi:hypothetical protein